ncbi:response regulator [Coleofasciculus sp. FACHB-64]|uniref:hybrid sensor histidine kinase/response regulator n=1 Tax=Cyanophyceae TaxID=3028117 RepID=UPI0016896056|nr:MULTISPECIES: response regulator [unclassified Coleofasciculus]MBD1838303.1 response regulator [Coleofasciculus sp. FACHB-501]MBD1888913.1 response regulator [Coleofasciculus sp. FACHB-SPT9]MBD1945286.1 response regulator [Coleofasciculus sp. FACHB-712]MBD2045003.1 response regulator [Coleofasciculus sp. FACHB-64]
MLFNSDREIVLVVDDNPTNLELLYNALGSSGYEVLVEMDGFSGIEQAKNYPPDLILLDVQMPGIDGFETCRKLQLDPSTKNIPVIFMTALTDTTDKVKGLHLGAVDYITKPFRHEEALARIQTHLKIRRLSLELEQQKQELEEIVQKRTAELTCTLQELKKTQLQLIQNEKLSTIGQLVSGIAHEINNPVGCISGNLEQASLAVKDAVDYIRLYQAKFPNPGIEIEQKAEEIDLEYLLEDLPKMFLSMHTGIDRIRNISTSLRTFSRADVDYKVSVDIHEGLESTLMILQHRLKAQNYRPAIQIIKNYGEIPKVECYLGQLNQVFMNILANAIDAVEEANLGHTYEAIKENPNHIIIQTEMKDEHQVAVRIADNGMGMTKDIKQRIFDHLFTTKPVGKGTGLGLTIAHQIIVEKHGGTLEVNSEWGRGTEFVVTLPIV